MTYLIDTSVLLWAMEGSSQLTKKAKEAIVDKNNKIYVSIVSLWEISIKMSIGKLKLSKTLDEIIVEIGTQSFTILPISVDSVKLVRNMPFHHKDPFDRLIIAQAQALDISIIASDQMFEAYGVDVLW